VGIGIVHLCALQETLTANLAGWASRLRQAATDLGGTLVIERCPVPFKSSADVWGPAGDDLDAMRKMKKVWDPAGVLAPGRFVGGI
jgi:glycolate oxidase FAD binding subunit